MVRTALALVAISCVTERAEPWGVIRVATVVGLIASAGLVFLSLYIVWTVVGYPKVEGVQGCPDCSSAQAVQPFPVRVGAHCSNTLTRGKSIKQRSLRLQLRDLESLHPDRLQVHRGDRTTTL
jgi:hypothetical protein